MSHFQVGGGDGASSTGGCIGDGSGAGGIDNPAMQTDRNDPVELNVYGLYTRKNSVSQNGGPATEMKRKSSYGFTHLTR